MRQFKDMDIFGHGFRLTDFIKRSKSRIAK